MKLWLVALTVLAAVPKAFSQDSSALQAVAEMPACAVCIFLVIVSLRIVPSTNIRRIARVPRNIDCQVALRIDEPDLHMHKSDATTKYASVCLGKLYHQGRSM